MPTVRQLARWLRRQFPIVAEGRIRRRALADRGNYGYVTPAGTIYLNSRYSESLQRETLLHEWAHLRVGVVQKAHTQEFWKELGRIDEAYQKWLEH